MNKIELQKAFEAVRSGDLNAFEEIYNYLKTPIFTIILRITHDIALSEDILQDVFIKLYQLPPAHLIKNPRAYIFQIAHNLAIDNLRKQPQYADLENIENIENLMYIPIDDVSDKLDIERALKSLPLQECQIVSLRINGELKFREIAAMLDIPLGTVLWKYKKAIERLRYLLSEYMVDTGGKL